MSAEHETRTTARLRWEPLSNGDALGYVTPGQWLYEIGKPSDDADDNELQLMSRLPGQTGHHTQGTDRAELEREAEEMLAEFTASLGAIFPDTLREAVSTERDAHLKQADETGDCPHAWRPETSCGAARALGWVLDKMEAGQ